MNPIIFSLLLQTCDCTAFSLNDPVLTAEEQEICRLTCEDIFPDKTVRDITPETPTINNEPEQPGLQLRIPDPETKLHASLGPVIGQAGNIFAGPFNSNKTANFIGTSLMISRIRNSYQLNASGQLYLTSPTSMSADIFGQTVMIESPSVNLLVGMRYTVLKERTGIYDRNRISTVSGSARHYISLSVGNRFGHSGQRSLDISLVVIAGYRRSNVYSFMDGQMLEGSPISMGSSPLTMHGVQVSTNWFWKIKKNILSTRTTGRFLLSNGWSGEKIFPLYGFSNQLILESTVEYYRSHLGVGVNIVWSNESRGLVQPSRAFAPFLLISF